MLIANSSAGLADMLSRCDRAPRGLVIANGIDTDGFNLDTPAGEALRTEWEIPRDAIVIGHVGRLHPVKNHPMLISAFATFAAKHANAFLVCVGDGKDVTKAALQSQASAAGVGERVKFAGPRRDLRAVYNAFDVLALSSDIEGFPNVVAEAMACGTPAVVTNAGASAEIVAELGEVSPRGDAAAFAEAMARLVARTSATLSAACRARIVGEFRMDHCATRTLEAFTTLIKHQAHA
jgi:glycosyltransferase involved in cell wall biosynthesis